jgi:hypothetical protein
VTAAWSDESQQHPDGGRLAGTVPAEQRVDLSSVDVEIQRIDGEHVAVAF